MKKIFLALILVFSSFAVVFAEQNFQLQIPVKCDMNKDCWIMNYVDNDETQNWHDYKGARQTYEGHTGTDFAIKDVSRMEQGVDVVAAASGIVVATRDGMPDKNALSQDLKQLQNIGAGNRVAIRHNDGWITDYCHLKNGSIKVKKGDYVLAGQKLGEIGMSGLTEFPHLHFNVQKNNRHFDPFTGLERYSQGYQCPLWSYQALQKLNYRPHVIYNAGVSQEIPTLLNIRNGKYRSDKISSDADMLMIWIDAMHVEADDIIEISVKNSDGTEFLKQNIIIDKANAEKFFYLGKRKTAIAFEKGSYKVQISFKRPVTNMDENIFFDFIIY